jgi:hypothetical protein
LIDSSPTEMNEPHPNGFLFKGEAEDKIRAGGDCDLSLATQFGERYEVYTRRESIPKMFTNLRSTCVTELVKIFGFDKHSVCRWIGHAEYIQDEHYLQMMDDDHAAAMSNLSTGKINPQINPSGTGSYLSEMVFIALHRNLPELVEAETEHALGITKIGKNKMFGTPAVRATPVWSPPRELVESSGGGTSRIVLKPRKIQGRQDEGVKYDTQYDTQTHLRCQRAALQTRTTENVRGGIGLVIWYRTHRRCGHNQPC